MRSLSIPKTKIRRPVLRQPIVARPRLIDRFDENCPLTLISAPAGSGKTTLALAWAASQSARVAWLSLDADDNDPIRFLRGFVAALETAGERLRLPAGQRGLKAIMADLINQWGEAEPIVFVLDDYHLITDESIHAALAYFLDHLPASFRFVIVTREEPRKVVGSVIFDGKPSADGTCSIAYGVEEMSQGKGYATEALRASISWALEQPECRRIRASTSKWHKRSMRVLEKVGMTCVGEREDPDAGMMLVYEISREK